MKHERALKQQGTGTGTGTGTGAGADVWSIHDRVATKEPGLADLLHYDAYERRSGLVHVLPTGTTPGAFARAEFEELADFVDQPYEVVEATTTGGGSHVRVVRHGHVRTAAGLVPVRVEKRVGVAGSRGSPTLTLDVSLENLGAMTVGGLLAVEWATTMLGGGANPAAYYVLDGERVPHDSTRSRPGLASLHSGNEYVGLDVATVVTPAADAWIAPIETVSNSEAGFERVYQGSALVLTWPLHLEPGARTAVRVEHRVSTSRDRAEAEGL